MKAIVCREHGPPETLVLDEVPEPTVGGGQVVVAMKAASVNYPDVLIIQNRYQVKPPLPFSPGSELAGVVTATGGGVTEVSIGDRVMALTTYGAFAEQVSVDTSRVLRMPETMDFTTASAFMLTYGTSYHALADRGGLRAGETLLVLGAAGGVGLAAVEIGRALGARVIACASTEEKLEVCVAHGATHTVNYARDDLRARIKDLTDGRGVDVVYDPVGGPYTEPALRSLAWRGRLLVVGFAAGEIPKLPLNLVLLKGGSIVGVYSGEFRRQEPERFAAMSRDLLELYEDGKLRPHVSAVWPLARAPEALALVAARDVKGKVVLVANGHGEAQAG